MDYKKKYFKYKEKYVKLKQLGGTTNSNIPKYNTDFTDEKYNTNIKIKIDDIYFMIICKSRDRDGRELFLLKSSLTNDFKNEFKMIKFYRSLSELNFLRLATKDFPRSSKYHKGKFHYTQQSFIDIRLQKFININISNIPFNTDFYIEYNPEIIKHIDDEKRALENVLFQKYEDQCGFYTDELIDYQETLKIMKNISKELKDNYNFSNNRYIYNYDIDDKDIKFSYNLYSIYLNNYSDPKENLILLYMIVDFCKYNNKSFIIKAFDNNISQFQNLDIGKECKYTNFYTPVFLTTEDSKITEYGTYNKYVVGKNYICKFLDYNQQCNYLEEFSNTCYLDNNYLIIADRYVDLFPFNELADTNLIKIIKEGNLTKENIEDNISSINIPNSNTGMTPLIYAIIYNKYSIDKIKLIIDKGADINYHNIYNNRSVLFYTIENKRFDIADLLFRKGANINYTGNGKYMSQLMIAIIFCDFDENQVDELFNLKPNNINYVYKNKSALELSIYYSKLSFIIALVDAGANINDNTGKSLIFYILDELTKNINDKNSISIENTIKILIEKNEENIAKSSIHLLVTNQHQHIHQYSENISKIITILFKLIDINIINYCDDRINIFHLYKLNTIYKLKMDTIINLYNNCQINIKDLTDIIVNNYDNYINFIDWIDKYKLFVNKIIIKENNTNKELKPPKDIKEFYFNDEDSTSDEDSNPSLDGFDYDDEPVKIIYGSDIVFPYKPLLFFKFNIVADSIVI